MIDVVGFLRLRIAEVGSVLSRWSLRQIEFGTSYIYIYI